jgi:hypothetical protein
MVAVVDSRAVIGTIFCRNQHAVEILSVSRVSSQLGRSARIFRRGLRQRMESDHVG